MWTGPAPPPASVPLASRAHAVREGSAPAAQTGEQGQGPSPPPPPGPAASHPTFLSEGGLPSVPSPRGRPPRPAPASSRAHLLSSPCRNKATCQDGPQGARCLCPAGYTGSSCQVRHIWHYVLGGGPGGWGAPVRGSQVLKGGSRGVWARHPHGELWKSRLWGLQGRGAAGCLPRGLPGMEAAGRPGAA